MDIIKKGFHVAYRFIVSFVLGIAEFFISFFRELYALVSLIVKIILIEVIWSFAKWLVYRPIALFNGVKKMIHAFTHRRSMKEIIKASLLDWKKSIKKDIWLYIMFIPVFIWIVVFLYFPKFGLLMAFQDFRPLRGFWGSDWVGLKHFKHFLNDIMFQRALKNTIVLNLYGIFFTFPLPIILALMINEVRQKLFKKLSQTIVFLPYFISTVVVVGLFIDLLSYEGLVNDLLLNTFGVARTHFILDPSYAVLTYFVVGIYQNTGYGTLIYIAALTSIDPNLYEAAKIDGASKMQEIKYITIPGIMPTIVIMLILRVGQMLNAAHERILLIYRPVTYEKLDVISTYVYRLGIDSFIPQYSYATAVGLFNSLVAMTLVYAANRVAKRTGSSLW